MRAAALNVLRLMARTGALREPERRPEREDDRPGHSAPIRRAGAAGAVLPRNEGGLLPLGPGVARIMGGGSAQLNPHRAVSPWDGLAARLGENRLLFAEGCTNHRWEPIWTGDLRAEFFAGRDLEGEPVHESRWARLRPSGSRP